MHGLLSCYPHTHLLDQIRKVMATPAMQGGWGWGVPRLFCMLQPPAAHRKHMKKLGRQVHAVVL